LIDPVFGFAAGLIFVATGIAYLEFGPTAGRITAVVLIVPFAVWLGIVVRRRRSDQRR
jgi:hypothetical protein